MVFGKKSGSSKSGGPKSEKRVTISDSQSTVSSAPPKSDKSKKSVTGADSQATAASSQSKPRMDEAAKENASESNSQATVASTASKFLGEAGEKIASVAQPMGEAAAQKVRQEARMPTQQDFKDGGKFLLSFFQEAGSMAKGIRDKILGSDSYVSPTVSVEQYVPTPAFAPRAHEPSHHYYPPSPPPEPYYFPPPSPPVPFENDNDIDHRNLPPCMVIDKPVMCCPLDQLPELFNQPGPPMLEPQPPIPPCFIPVPYPIPPLSEDQNQPDFQGLPPVIPPFLPMPHPPDMMPPYPCPFPPLLPGMLPPINPKSHKKRKSNKRRKRSSSRGRECCVVEERDDGCCQRKSWAHPSVKRKKWWLHPLWSAEERRRNVPKLEDPFRKFGKKDQLNDDGQWGQPLTLESSPVSPPECNGCTASSWQPSPTSPAYEASAPPGQRSLNLQYQTSPSPPGYATTVPQSPSPETVSKTPQRKEVFGDQFGTSVDPIRSSLQPKDVFQTGDRSPLPPSSFPYTKERTSYSASQLPNKTSPQLSPGNLYQDSERHIECKTMTQISTTVIRSILVSVTRKRKHPKGKSVHVSVNLAGNGENAVTNRPPINIVEETPRVLLSDGSPQMELNYADPADGQGQEQEQGYQEDLKTHASPKEQEDEKPTCKSSRICDKKEKYEPHSCACKERCKYCASEFTHSCSHQPKCIHTYDPSVRRHTKLWKRFGYKNAYQRTENTSSSDNLLEEDCADNSRDSTPVVERNPQTYLCSKELSSETDEDISECGDCSECNCSDEICGSPCWKRLEQENRQTDCCTQCGNLSNETKRKRIIRSHDSICFKQSCADCHCCFTSKGNLNTRLGQCHGSPACPHSHSRREITKNLFPSPPQNGREDLTETRTHVHRHCHVVKNPRGLSRTFGDCRYSGSGTDQSTSAEVEDIKADYESSSEKHVFTDKQITLEDEDDERCHSDEANRIPGERPKGIKEMDKTFNSCTTQNTNSTQSVITSVGSVTSQLSQMSPAIDYEESVSLLSQGKTTNSIPPPSIMSCCREHIVSCDRKNPHPFEVYSAIFAVDSNSEPNEDANSPIFLSPTMPSDDDQYNSISEAETKFKQSVIMPSVFPRKWCDENLQPCEVYSAIFAKQSDSETNREVKSDIKLPPTLPPDENVHDAQYRCTPETETKFKESYEAPPVYTRKWCVQNPHPFEVYSAIFATNSKSGSKQEANSDMFPLPTAQEDLGSDEERNWRNRNCTRKETDPTGSTNKQGACSRYHHRRSTKRAGCSQSSEKLSRSRCCQDDNLKGKIHFHPLKALGGSELCTFRTKADVKLEDIQKSEPCFSCAQSSRTYDCVQNQDETNTESGCKWSEERCQETEKQESECNTQSDLYWPNCAATESEPCSVRTPPNDACSDNAKSNTRQSRCNINSSSSSDDCVREECRDLDEPCSLENERTPCFTDKCHIRKRNKCDSSESSGECQFQETKKGRNCKVVPTDEDTNNIKSDEESTPEVPCSCETKCYEGKNVKFRNNSSPCEDKCEQRKEYTKKPHPPCGEKCRDFRVFCEIPHSPCKYNCRKSCKSPPHCGEMNQKDNSFHHESLPCKMKCSEGLAFRPERPTCCHKRREGQEFVPKPPAYGRKCQKEQVLCPESPPPQRKIQKCQLPNQKPCGQKRRECEVVCQQPPSCAQKPRDCQPSCQQSPQRGQMLRQKLPTCRQKCKKCKVVCPKPSLCRDGCEKGQGKVAHECRPPETSRASCKCCELICPSASQKQNSQCLQDGKKTSKNEPCKSKLCRPNSNGEPCKSCFQCHESKCRNCILCCKSSACNKQSKPPCEKCELASPMTCNKCSKKHQNKSSQTETKKPCGKCSKQPKARLTCPCENQSVLCQTCTEGSNVASQTQCRKHWKERCAEIESGFRKDRRDTCCERKPDKLFQDKCVNSIKDVACQCKLTETKCNELNSSICSDSHFDSFKCSPPTDCGACRNVMPAPKSFKTCREKCCCCTMHAPREPSVGKGISETSIVAQLKVHSASNLCCDPNYAGKNDNLVSVSSFANCLQTLAKVYANIDIHPCRDKILNCKEHKETVCTNKRSETHKDNKTTGLEATHQRTAHASLITRNACKLCGGFESLVTTKDEQMKPPRLFSKGEAMSVPTSNKLIRFEDCYNMKSSCQQAGLFENRLCSQQLRLLETEKQINHRLFNELCICDGMNACCEDCKHRAPENTKASCSCHRDTPTMPAGRSFQFSDQINTEINKQCGCDDRPKLLRNLFNDIKKFGSNKKAQERNTIHTFDHCTPRLIPSHKCALNKCIKTYPLNLQRKSSEIMHIRRHPKCPLKCFSRHFSSPSRHCLTLTRPRLKVTSCHLKRFTTCPSKFSLRRESVVSMHSARKDKCLKQIKSFCKMKITPKFISPSFFNESCHVQMDQLKQYKFANTFPGLPCTRKDIEFINTAMKWKHLVRGSAFKVKMTDQKPKNTSTKEENEGEAPEVRSQPPMPLQNHSDTQHSDGNKTPCDETQEPNARLVNSNNEDNDLCASYIS